MPSLQIRISHQLIKIYNFSIDLHIYISKISISRNWLNPARWNHRIRYLVLIIRNLRISRQLCKSSTLDIEQTALFNRINKSIMHEDGRGEIKTRKISREKDTRRKIDHCDHTLDYRYAREMNENNESHSRDVLTHRTRHTISWSPLDANCRPASGVRQHRFRHHWNNFCNR